MVRAKTKVAPLHSDVLIARLRALQTGSLVGAEVGVLGGSLSYKALRDLPNLHLHMVDTWPGSAQHGRTPGGPLGTVALYEQAMEWTAFAQHRRTVHECDSVVAAERITDGSLDFVFIDADHRYEAVLRDLAAWWPKIRVGGLFCGDDYQNDDRLDTERGHMLCGVKRAVDEFLEQLGLLDQLMIDDGPTWFLRVPG